MADDHTSQAWGVYGSRLDSLTPTPHIRQLAQEGVLLNRAYCTNSICVPSRAAILTGQYSHVNGVYTLSDGLDPQREHVAKHLQQAGYQTAMIGKWHLKTQPTGFDYYHVLPGQGRYHDPYLKEMGKPWEDANQGGEVVEGFSTDVITDQALAWLERRHADQPFFLMCHFKAVHEPFDFAERYADMFKDREIPLPESFFEDLSHRSAATNERGMFMRDLMLRYLERAPNYPAPALDTTGMDMRQALQATYQKFIKDYLRGVAGIDDNIGRIMDYLDEKGLADQTVLIYTSDQGYFLGEHGYIDKRWMYEESARMPFVIRYPQLLAPGTQNDDLITNVDFAPTFLEMAGIAKPQEMQGRSFWANLQGQRSEDWRTSFYYRYWQHERRAAHYGVRTDRYKLIFFYAHPLDMKGTTEAASPGWEFYDLATDPYELDNRYGDPAYTPVIDSLKQVIDQHRSELGDLDLAYPEMQEIRTKYWE